MKAKASRKNNILAVKWLLLAADQRDPDAQRVLGNLHEQVQGGARDYVRALMWYKLAAMSGDTDAPRAYRQHQNLMTPGQRAEAEERMSDW
jgi:TPR repeat protein